jgi:hypothetical protein
MKASKRFCYVGILRKTDLRVPLYRRHACNAVNMTVNTPGLAVMSLQGLQHVFPACDSRLLALPALQCASSLLYYAWLAALNAAFGPLRFRMECSLGQHPCAALDAVPCAGAKPVPGGGSGARVPRMCGRNDGPSAAIPTERSPEL